MSLPPMAEIDFWRDRSSKVSTVYEQLQLPGVKKAGFRACEKNLGELFL
jgi:hypothetical protein